MLPDILPWLRYAFNWPTSSNPAKSGSKIVLPRRLIRNKFNYFSKAITGGEIFFFAGFFMINF
jgi:hypothetical protein